MTLTRLLPALSALAIGLVLGLTACKPAPPAATAPDAASAAAADSVHASTAEKVSAAVDAINPITSPREAVIASMHKLMDATSYHVSMQMDGGPKGLMDNQVDFVAPDRFRMEMAGMGTQVIVGDTMYMSMQGRRMQVPMPKDTTNKWRDPGNFREAAASMTADSMGSESVDGISAQKYNVHQTVPTTAEYILWVGADGMPLQMRMNSDMKGKPVTTTMRYSRINDPTLSIDAPK